MMWSIIESIEWLQARIVLVPFTQCRILKYVKIEPNFTGWPVLCESRVDVRVSNWLVHKNLGCVI